MPAILSFEKPERAVSVEEWKDRSADGAPPGVYTSNMSKVDLHRWKAKLVGIRSEAFQIEIRSGAPGANTVVVVNGGKNHPTWHGRNTNHEVKISANGPMWFSRTLWAQLQAAIEEAHQILRRLDADGDERKATLEAIRQGKNPLDTNP
jgi:hypothetical protein